MGAFKMKSGEVIHSYFWSRGRDENWRKCGLRTTEPRQNILVPIKKVRSLTPLLHHVGGPWGANPQTPKHNIINYTKQVHPKMPDTGPLDHYVVHPAAISVTPTVSGLGVGVWGSGMFR